MTCVKRVYHDVSSWLLQMRLVGHLCVSQCIYCEYLIVGKQDDAIILGQIYFSAASISFRFCATHLVEPGKYKNQIFHTVA